MRSYESLVKHEGNAALFSAVEISIVAAIAGRPVHVHAEGVRGTGKTTIMRSAATVLPKIERIAGCQYNCKPWVPHCPEHRQLPASRIRELPTERIPMPFMEVSHSAKLGTVVGSIDLARVVDRTNPEAAILLGTLPRANRGIVFIDEINRLADTSPELTDVLLDVMGTKPGRVQIEESGLPVVSAPVEISVWAASNPDEDPGPLEDVRRQLSDRFDLSVEVGRASEPMMIRRILEADDFWQTGAGAPDAMLGTGQSVGLCQRSCMGDEAPCVDLTPSPSTAGTGGWLGRLAAAAALVAHVRYPDELVELLAQLYVDFDIESIRAMESAGTASRCRAALSGRSVVSLQDIRAVLPMVLRHRLEVASLSNVLRYVDALSERAAQSLQTGALIGAKQTRNEAASDAGGMEHDGSMRSDTDYSEPSGAACGQGFRGVLHRFLERMRSEQTGTGGRDSGAQRPDSQGATSSSPSRAGGETGESATRGGSEGGPGGTSGYAGGSEGGPGGTSGYAGGAAGKPVPHHARGSSDAPGTTGSNEPSKSADVVETCPPNAARPITEVGSKLVYAEDELV